VDHVKPFSTELNAFILPGNVLSVAAGRLSFMFGLRGPSMAMDTACSSSIVAAHAARTTILSGDIAAAAAAGVNAIMAGAPFASLSLVPPSPCSSCLT